MVGLCNRSFYSQLIFPDFLLRISSGSERDNKNFELWYQHSQTHFFIPIWRNECVKTTCKITAHFPSDFSLKYFNQNRTCVASYRNKDFFPLLTTLVLSHRETSAKLMCRIVVPKTAKAQHIAGFERMSLVARS